MLLKSAMYGINAANYVKTYRPVYNECFNPLRSTTFPNASTDHLLTVK